MSQPNGHRIPFVLIGSGLAAFGLYLLTKAVPDRRWFAWTIVALGAIVAALPLRLIVRDHCSKER